MREELRPRESEKGILRKKLVSKKDEVSGKWRRLHIAELRDLHCSLNINRLINPLKPNDAYICRTAPLTSRCCILCIYSTNIRTEYFKHAANSPFFPLQNAVYFIILHCFVPVLFAFYIEGVLKFKCKIQAPKG